MTKNIFLTTMPVLICKVIFVENYSLPKVPSKYLDH
jgi:hypothetical protein